MKFINAPKTKTWPRLGDLVLVKLNDGRVREAHYSGCLWKTSAAPDQYLGDEVGAVHVIGWMPLPGDKHTHPETLESYRRGLASLESGYPKIRVDPEVARLINYLAA